MKWIGFHVAWLLLLTTTFCFAAGQASRSAPDPVSVDYLANEAYAPEQGYVVVRSAFEVHGPPHRWVALDMEFRLSQAVPLVRADGKAFMKRWNDLFLPESPAPARWTDCRLDVNFPELEKAKNLPKDKAFVLWAMGLIFDHGIGKHVGSGWAARAPIILTTDAAGRIQGARTPTFAPIRFAYPSDKTVDARRAKIRTNHLQPLPGVEAYRAIRRDGTPVTVLTGPRGQLWKPADFGGAFGPIDSAKKAEEFVRLPHPGGVILRTSGQYNAVIDAARKLGFPPETISKDDPESFGLFVTPVEGLGWRVEALLIEPYKNGLGDVAAWDYTICTDGRASAKRKVFLHGPDGKTKFPVSADVYTAVMQSGLAGFPPDMISPRIVPTNDVAKLPLPADFSDEEFVSPTAPFAAPEPVFTPPPTDVSSTPDPTKPPADADVITTPGPTPIRKSE